MWRKLIRAQPALSCAHSACAPLYTDTAMRQRVHTHRHIVSLSTKKQNALFPGFLLSLVHVLVILFCNRCHLDNDFILVIYKPSSKFLENLHYINCVIDLKTTVQINKSIHITCYFYSMWCFTRLLSNLDEMKWNNLPGILYTCIYTGLRRAYYL